MKDPNLLSVKSQLALFKGQLDHLNSQLDETHDPEIWDALDDTVKRMKRAMAGDAIENDPSGFKSICRQMLSIIEQGKAERGIWNDIIRLTSELAKLAKQEQSLITAQQGMITAEQAAALVTVLVKAVQVEAAMALPPKQAEELYDRVAARVADAVGGAPKLEDVRIVGGVPLVPYEANKWKAEARPH